VTLLVLYKLLAIAMTVALGWSAAKARWLGAGDTARTLSNVAFFVFVPALLFRTTARLDFATVPGPLLAAYFAPTVLVLLACYGWARWRRTSELARPSVEAVSVTFGNTVQLGIPMAAALFSEQGLALHIALVSVHALVLLSCVTALAERDLAQGQGWRRQLMQTVRNTVIHPVVLPVLAGLAWNLTGAGLHPVVDEVLALLASAVVPLCLVLIGVSLAQYGVQGRWRVALRLAAVKLLVLPAVVLLVAGGVLGLSGLPLAVVVMMSALPVGSNALLFAQRYRTLEGEVTAAIVVSTVAFVATAGLWLAVLQHWGGMGV
jgi:malonate transporter and related proteins